MRLTKSEFMLGRTCLTKVQHLRNGLASVKDDNSFVEDLSGVGAIVHWIAPQLYGNIVASNLSITDILPGAYGTYVEVTVPALTKQARIDILRYTDSGIQVVEVKSRCYPVDTTEHDGLPTVAERSGDPAKWRDLIDDICFQYVTLIEAKAEDRSHTGRGVGTNSRTRATQSLR